MRILIPSIVSSGSVRFKILGILAFSLLLSGTSFINYSEKKEESDHSIQGVVSVITKNYIALVFSDNKSGTQEEVDFKRNEDIRLLHKRSWEEIHPGENVVAGYVELRLIREGKAENGALKTEWFTLDRRLQSLKFDKTENTPLESRS